MQGRHPSTAEEFEWQPANVEHLSRRSPIITEDEVEEIFNNNPVWVPSHRETSDFKMIGRTDAGRQLTIIVEWKAEKRILRAFSGWPCTAGERKRYLGKRR